MDRSMDKLSGPLGMSRIRRKTAEFDEVTWRLAIASALVEDQRLRALASETPVASERLIEARQREDVAVETRDRLLAQLTNTPT